jgi:hypothetical protein
MFLLPFSLYIAALGLMLGIGHLAWRRGRLDRDEKRFWWHFAVATTWFGVLLAFVGLWLANNVSLILVEEVTIIATVAAIALLVVVRLVYPKMKITIMEAHLNPEQQVNLIRIEFPENKKQKPIEREAYFYFISVRNEHGPTVENFKVRFNAATKGKGWGKSLELIFPTGKNVFTIPARHGFNYAPQADPKDWYSTVATSKYQKESATLYEKGSANKTLEFALFYTIKDAKCITFPGGTWHHFQTPCEFDMRLEFFGDELPPYQAAAYHVKVTTENWNKPEVGRVELTNDS